MVKKRATILDVAAAAGVTDGTVSRALAGSPKVKAATRERILAVAAKLGYQANASARALKQGSHGAIGVFCSGGSWIFYNDYFGQLLAGVADAAERDGQRLVFYLPEVTVVDHNPEHDQVRLRGLEALADGRVDGGIVIGGQPKDSPSLKQLRESGLPLVLLSPDKPLPGFGLYGSGIQRRMGLAAEALLRAGRTRLGYLGLFKGSLHNSQSFDAVRAVVRRKGLADPVLAEVSHRNFCAPENLRPQMKTLLKAGCDGWVVSNASQACVALDLLAEEGVQAPRDLSVITLGPVPASQWGRPVPLAVVSADLMEDGERCYQMFQALKRGESVEPQEIHWYYKALPKSTLA